MTPSQLEVLQHALGADKYGQMPKNPYRNHYVGEDESCRELVSLGHMIEMKPRAISGGEVWFMVTESGREAMRQESPKPPKISRSTKRFDEYRSFSDAYDCTFREWLDIRKTDWYKDMKEGGVR